MYLFCKSRFSWTVSFSAHSMSGQFNSRIGCVCKYLCCNSRQATSPQVVAHKPTARIEGHFIVVFIVVVQPKILSILNSTCQNFCWFCIWHFSFPQLTETIFTCLVFRHTVGHAGWLKFGRLVGGNRRHQQPWWVRVAVTNPRSTDTTDATACQHIVTRLLASDDDSRNCRLPRRTAGWYWVVVGTLVVSFNVSFHHCLKIWKAVS